MSEGQHAVDYLELPATDIGAMKQFHGAACPSGNELAVWSDKGGDS